MDLRGKVFQRRIRGNIFTGGKQGLVIPAQETGESETRKRIVF